MAKDKKKKKRFRWWRIPIIIVLVIVLAAGGYVAYLLLSYHRIPDKQALDVYHEAQNKEVMTDTEYTAVTANLGFGAYTADYTFFMDGGTESWAASKESVVSCIDGSADLIKEQHPDIVFLQEVDDDSTRSYHIDQRQMLNDSFKGYDSVFARNFHSAFLVVPPTQPHGFANSGLLTLTDFEMTDDAVRRSLPISESMTKFFDLDRCYSVSRAKVANGKELVLIDLHLSAYGTNGDLQTQQMTMLFNEMEEEYNKGNYVIAAGDFNHDFTVNSKEVFNDNPEIDLSWAAPFPDELIPEGISKVTDYASGITIPSCRNCDVPYSDECFTIIVDGFLVSDNVTPTYVDIIDNGFRYSDHNPVVMKFQLKSQ